MGEDGGGVMGGGGAGGGEGGGGGAMTVEEFDPRRGGHTHACGAGQRGQARARGDAPT